MLLFPVHRAWLSFNCPTSRLDEKRRTDKINTAAMQETYLSLSLKISESSGFLLLFNTMLKEE